MNWDTNDTILENRNMDTKFQNYFFLTKLRFNIYSVNKQEDFLIIFKSPFIGMKRNLFFTSNDGKGKLRQTKRKQGKFK